MSIASNLRREIDAQGVSVASVAARIGAERSTVRKYLNGTAKPNNAVLARLAAVLGTTPDEIRNGRQRHGGGKLTTDEVSAYTGIDPLSLRIGLQRGVWPFGTAYKRPGSTKYVYEYDPEAVIRWMNAKNALREASDNEKAEPVPGLLDRKMDLQTG